MIKQILSLFLLVMASSVISQASDGSLDIKANTEFDINNPPEITEHPDVQSVLLRGVVVTHKLEESIKFYRDIMGQKIVEWYNLDAKRSQKWLDVSEEATIVHIIFKGSGEYPGGPIEGGRMSLIGIEDPKNPMEETDMHPGRHGDVIFPHRVSNIDEIYRRIQDANIKVLYPPSLSSTGLSRSMMVYEPNGNIVEMFELFNTKRNQ